MIAVCLNNSVNTSVSPGEQPDFFFYGGLYRDVNIHVMDSLHITDAVYANKIAGGGVFVTDSAVSATSAIVRVKTDVLNEGVNAKSCMLKTSLIDSNGAVLQTRLRPRQRLPPARIPPSARALQLQIRGCGVQATRTCTGSSPGYTTVRCPPIR